jgi:NTE family protein
MIWPAVRIGDASFVDGGIRSTTKASDVDPPSSRSLLTVRPDELSVAAFGDNPLDPAIRSASAQSGFRQARDLVESLKEFWSEGSTDSRLS